eukprot:6432811-Amphidinium_carterae.1
MAEANGLATNTGMERRLKVWSHDTWVQVDKDLGIMQEKGPPSDGLIGNTVASSFAALADEVREAMNAAKACQDELAAVVADENVDTLSIAQVKVGEIIKEHFQPYFNDDNVLVKEHSGKLLKELLDIPRRWVPSIWRPKRTGLHWTASKHTMRPIIQTFHQRGCSPAPFRNG